jgi:hypothetical protein
MTRATDELLDQLHGMQASSLLSEMKTYIANGESIPPALFAQVNKFLKDNGVDRAVQPGDPTDLLAESVPDFKLINGDFTQ